MRVIQGGTIVVTETMAGALPVNALPVPSALEGTPDDARFKYIKYDGT